MPPRISLATLIGIVAVIALGLAGMLSTSRLWLMLVSTVALARGEAAGMEALGRLRSKATAQRLASSER